MRKLLTIIVLLCAGVAALAQGVTAKGPAQVPQYGLARFAVVTESVPSNPYLQEEAVLDMLITAPSGKQLVLPCFWLEGHTWEARFTPQEKGKYSYCFRYKEAGKPESRSATGSLKAGKARGHGILHTDPASMWILRYDDGTPYRGVAENICWESRASDDSKFFKELHEQADRFNYDVMLPDFAAAGGNFTRMWMCSWNFPIDRKDRFNNRRYTPSDAYYNPSAVNRLDYVVDLAEKLGVNIMLCMGPGDGRADASFFTSPEARARYKNRLRFIVARWGYSAAIGMWEFFNEIDNVMFNGRKDPIPAADVVAWHSEMAAYLKALDPYGHIVTTSISHRDIPGLNDVADMDVNQKHIYRATASIPGTIVSYEKEHGKPYVIGEFSFEWDWSKNFDDFAEDMDLDFKRGLWYGLFSSTPVTPMSWWWEYFQNRNMVPYFRNVRYVSDRMLAAGKGQFEALEVKASGADVYAVRCGKVTYVYAYNPGTAPVAAITLPYPKAKGKAASLDFAAHRFGKAAVIQAAGGSLSLPVNLGPREEILFEIR